MITGKKQGINDKDLKEWKRKSKEKLNKSKTIHEKNKKERIIFLKTRTFNSVNDGSISGMLFCTRF